jgi:AraC-like DNA-binding protein
MNGSHRRVAPSYFVDVVCRYAGEAGIDLAGVLEAIGVETDRLTSPTQRIPIETCLALWDEVAARSNDPDFGLHFGEKINQLSPGHLMTTLLMNCATIGEALDKMTCYQSLSLDFFRTAVHVEGNYVCRVIESNVADVALQRHHAEAALCVLTQTLRLLTRGEIQFTAARFTHPRPAAIDEHLRIFACPVLFDRPRTELQFPRAVLAWPIPMADAQLLTQLEDLAQRTLRAIYQPESWSERVACRIDQCLLRHEAPTLTAVAQLLTISPRQLQNHLRQEAVTFQKLLDKQRLAAALRYLRDDTLTLCDIACRLGFSGQSTFNHAFKRWTGLSPSEYLARC